MIVITWVWGTKYGPHYITRLRNGLRRHCGTGYKLVVASPRPFEDDELRPGCLCRLRMFSLDWQHAHGIGEGEPFLCLDLDLIITGRLDRVVDRDQDFVILEGANVANPCPFNGSVMMFRGGRHAEVWDDFSLQKAAAIPYYEFPDDQAWIWHKLPHAAVWTVGSSSGIYAFRKPGWPKDDQLPSDAVIVAFPGSRDPSQFTSLPWVREHWA